MWMCFNSKRTRYLKNPEVLVNPIKFPHFSRTLNITLICKKRHSLIYCSQQGYESTGTGRGGPNAIDFCQWVAGFYQDVPIRGEFWARRCDDVGGSGTCHRPGTHSPRHNTRGTSEEDYEQRDGVTSANVRHFARFPRVIATAHSIANESYVKIDWSAWNFNYSMDLTNSHFFEAPRRTPSIPDEKATPRETTTRVSSRTRNYLVRATMSLWDYLLRAQVDPVLNSKQLAEVNLTRHLRNWTPVFI